MYLKLVSEFYLVPKFEVTLRFFFHQKLLFLIIFFRVLFCTPKLKQKVILNKVTTNNNIFTLEKS